MSVRTPPYLAGSPVADTAIHAGPVRYLVGGDMKAAQLARLVGAVDLDAYSGPPLVAKLAERLFAHEAR